MLYYDLEFTSVEKLKAVIEPAKIKGAVAAVAVEKRCRCLPFRESTSDPSPALLIAMCVPMTRIRLKNKKCPLLAGMFFAECTIRWLFVGFYTKTAY